MARANAMTDAYPAEADSYGSWLRAIEALRLRALMQERLRIVRCIAWRTRDAG